MLSLSVRARPIKLQPQSILDAQSILSPPTSVRTHLCFLPPRSSNLFPFVGSHVLIHIPGGGGGGGRRRRRCCGGLIHMESGGQDPSRPAREEVEKKNTDCVHFLASPSTCKKGNECEYRHSEGARGNPRDCWFWLNGNCLNPKCSFRHPQLDGALRSPTIHQGFSLPSTQTTMSTVTAYAPAAHISNKQSTHCYYFQMGGCLKGDRCPFIHDVQPGKNPVPQQMVKVYTSVMETTSAVKSTSWVLENCVEHNIPKISAGKQVEDSQTPTKVDAKAATTLTSGLSFKSSIVPSPLSNLASHAFPPVNVASSISDVSIRPEGHQLEPFNEHVHNGRDADESLRESSPGFDVLVDDECDDTNYFPVDDRDTSSHDVNNPSVVNDFDYHNFSVYSSMAQVEQEMCGAHNEVSQHDRHGWRDRSCHDDYRYSERIMDEVSLHGKRTVHREDCLSGMDEPDLRHQLLKRRKVNRLRSAINTDHHGELYQKDDHYAGKQRYHSCNSVRDQHHSSHEGSISKHLRGRITLPGRPPSDGPSNMHSEKERARGKDWARSLSPGQPSGYQGRVHDRIVWSLHETINLEGQPRRDEVDPMSFTGPKSLAELRNAKSSTDTNDRLSRINNRSITQEQKNLRLDKALGPHESEGSLSFEGPRPLSEILKRKREAALGNDAIPSDGHKNNQKATEDSVGAPVVTATTDSQGIFLLESQHRECRTASKTEMPKSAAIEEEGLSVTDGEGLPHTDQSSAKEEKLEGEDNGLADNIEDPEVDAYNQTDGELRHEIAEGADFKTEDSEMLSHQDQSSHKEEMLELENGMLVGDMEDSEENYDQKDGQFEYDVVDNMDFRTYDENDQKDEYNVDDDEDDDDDDFARKIGVMFS